MSLQNITFIDIETVPEYSKNNLDERADGEFYEVPLLFEKKFIRQIEESAETGIDFYHKTAGLYAEFGKVVCVSIGKIGEKTSKFYIKTMVGKDEKKILTDFALALNNTFILCGHNAKNFDLPFLYRRYIINGLPVPGVLNVAGKKPWDIPHLDTMELWSHMQYKYTCSLDLLAHVLGLPSPKKDMDGSQVGEVYYSMFDVKGELHFDKEESVLKRIGGYCANDVLTTAMVLAKLKGLEFDNEVEYVA